MLLGTSPPPSPSRDLSPAAFRRGVRIRSFSQRAVLAPPGLSGPLSAPRHEVPAASPDATSRDYWIRLNRAHALASAGVDDTPVAQPVRSRSPSPRRGERTIIYRRRYQPPQLLTGDPDLQSAEVFAAGAAAGGWQRAGGTEDGFSRSRASRAYSVFRYSLSPGRSRPRAVPASDAEDLLPLASTITAGVPGGATGGAAAPSDAAAEPAEGFQLALAFSSVSTADHGDHAAQPMQLVDGLPLQGGSGAGAVSSDPPPTTRHLRQLLVSEWLNDQVAVQEAERNSVEEIAHRLRVTDGVNVPPEPEFYFLREPWIWNLLENSPRRNWRRQWGVLMRAAEHVTAAFFETHDEVLTALERWRQTVQQIGRDRAEGVWSDTLQSLVQVMDARLVAVRHAEWRTEEHLTRMESPAWLTDLHGVLETRPIGEDPQRAAEEAGYRTDWWEQGRQSASQATLARLLYEDRVELDSLPEHTAPSRRFYETHQWTGETDVLRTPAEQEHVAPFPSWSAENFSIFALPFAQQN